MTTVKQLLKEIQPKYKIYVDVPINENASIYVKVNKKAFIQQCIGLEHEPIGYHIDNSIIFIHCSY